MCQTVGAPWRAWQRSIKKTSSAIEEAHVREWSALEWPTCIDILTTCRVTRLKSVSVAWQPSPWRVVQREVHETRVTTAALYSLQQYIILCTSCGDSTGIGCRQPVNITDVCKHIRPVRVLLKTPDTHGPECIKVAHRLWSSALFAWMAAKLFAARHRCQATPCGRQMSFSVTLFFNRSLRVIKLSLSFWQGVSRWSTIPVQILWQEATTP